MSSTPGSGAGGAPGSNPAGVSLLSFLQTELLVLSNEARRKNPEIKDVLDDQVEAYLIFGGRRHWIKCLPGCGN
jgi:hypothetical protein